MVVLIVFKQGAFCFLNNMATVAHHSYLRWQPSGNLKTKTNVFQTDLFPIPIILSLDKRLQAQF